MQCASYTMLVDHHGNALPIGFIRSAHEDAETLSHCMELFATAARSVRPAWRLSWLVTEDNAAEHMAVVHPLPVTPPDNWLVAAKRS